MLDDAALAPAFPRDEFESRLKRTREGLVARGLDAGLFFSAESLYYLSGYEFPTHAGFQLLVVPVDHPPFLVMRQHLESGVLATSWLSECVTFPDTGDPVQTTRQILEKHDLATRRLGIEETALSLPVRTARALADVLSQARLGDCSGIIETLRLVKSPREIAYVRQAAALSDLGLEVARATVAAGVSERDIAVEVTRQMMAAGAEYQAIPLLVGIEERSRLATPLWSARCLGPGELLWIEVFGTIRRYAAGLKASFGARPASPDAERRAETARLALERAIATIVPGRPASVIPDAVQETFRDAGYGESPYHQSGYSIGIAFAPNPHEARILSLRRGNSTPLQEGMTLFPIANLYGPGATVSASAMVVVTATGCERLTHFRPSPSDLSR